jgi:MFS family permease
MATAPEAFAVRFGPPPSGPRITVAGEHDLVAATQLRRRLDRLRRGGARRVDEQPDPLASSSAPRPLRRGFGREPRARLAEPALAPPVRPLAPLKVRNFRRFVAGQTVSLIGSWTETVAQALLVLHLTGSGVWLGLATAARYLPVLLLTPYAGVIVDRDDKRRVLLFTQASLAVLSLLLGLVVVIGVVRLWMVFVVALGFGTLTALDNPARMAFIPEVVGRDLLRGAITLNSTMVNVGRAVGPVVAAALVSSIGLGWCFVANGMSFVAVIAALLAIDVSVLHPSIRIPRRSGQLREGLAYARRVPEIIGPLCMMALIGTFTYEFEVSLPLLARSPLHGSVTTYSWLLGAFGLGSVLGGIWGMRHPQTGVRRMVAAALLYTAGMAGTALAPSVPVAVALLVVVGLASITFLTTGNSTIQLAAAPEFRGRATALWSTAFVGSTPIGATIIGAIGEASPRLAIGVGACACLAAAAVGLTVLRRVDNRCQPGDHKPVFDPLRHEAQVIEQPC